MFDLPRLTKFNVSSNNVSGSIPKAVSHCTSLMSMDLSCNGLVGEIPKGIEYLKDLNILNLSRNHLSGHIPNAFGAMKSLVTLDLSHNNLVGRVPTDGQFLVFGNNSFAGNPNLCFRQQLSCPSVAYADANTHRSHASCESSPMTNAISIALVIALAFNVLKLINLV